MEGGLNLGHQKVQVFFFGCLASGAPPCGTQFWHFELHLKAFQRPKLFWISQTTPIILYWTVMFQSRREKTCKSGPAKEAYTKPSSVCDLAKFFTPHLNTQDGGRVGAIPRKRKNCEASRGEGERRTAEPGSATERKREWVTADNSVLKSKKAKRETLRE